MKVDELFEDEYISCDNVWILSLILLLMNDTFKKSEPKITVYINGDKVGE